jgi:2-polyprenyl-3-methyl-5-hydroxy-6-metoxy-1,4-benzoquinol methylase
MTDERIKYYYTSGLSRKCSGNSYEWMDEREHARANSLIETLKKHNIQPKVHLDIGAGRGFFLEATKKNFGTEIYGTDLYEEYAKVDYAKNIDKPADLVSCIHTLEHCTDPVEDLKNFRKSCSK